MRLFTPLSGNKQAEPKENLSQNESLKSLNEGFNPVHSSFNNKVPFEKETSPFPQNVSPYKQIYIQSEDSSIGRPISAESKDILPSE